MQQVEELSLLVGTKPACEAYGVARASIYRRRRPHRPRDGSELKRPTPKRALTVTERQDVLAILHSTRFVDKAPAQVFAILLDEKKYLCSTRTMYRILSAEGETRERRDQLRHRHHPMPVLRATQPNQVWSWDITKLLGPVKWTYFYLYVVLDIFSRYVVAWMVSPKENGSLAKLLLTEAFDRQRVAPGELTVHSDRGTPMTSKLLTQKLADLGVTKSFSRPRVSNDNPYSESHFKTLKNRPEYPGRFGSIEDARSFCRRFFAWYNNDHRHSGIGYLPPAVVHAGRAEVIQRERSTALAAAFLRTPERFVKGIPLPPMTPTEAWINSPATSIVVTSNSTIIDANNDATVQEEAPELH